MQFIVTTPQSKTNINPLLDEFLTETGLPFVSRRRKSISQIEKNYNARGVIVWQASGPILYIQGQKFYYHPSMAKNRISVFRKQSIKDPLIKALKFTAGDKILDCTLGLGADAVVIAYFNSNGHIIGLEDSPIIASIVKWGMKLYHSKLTWLDEAIHRIEVIQAEHLNYLQSLPDNSFDIIYFDPMFRTPLLKSKPLSPLRLLANPKPLSVATVKEACRVARKRVVIKELAGSKEFVRLGITRFSGSPNNKISYGIIDL